MIFYLHAIGPGAADCARLKPVAERLMLGLLSTSGASKARIETSVTALDPMTLSDPERLAEGFRWVVRAGVEGGAPLSTPADTLAASWTTPLTTSLATPVVAAVAEALATARAEVPGTDWFMLPDRRPYRALACDMDHTCVAEETLVAAAERAGVATEVDQLTRGSTSGTLDFTASLRERIRMLRGLSVRDLVEIGHTVPLNAGIEALVARANRAGALTVLVTGGLTPTAEVVAQRLGFRACISNQVGIVGGRLDGTLTDPVVDGPGKRTHLSALLRAQGLRLEQTVATGDGANDCEMLGGVGLGVAFRAAEVLRGVTPHWLDHGTLAGIADLADWA